MVDESMEYSSFFPSKTVFASYQLEQEFHQYCHGGDSSNDGKILEEQNSSLKYDILFVPNQVLHNFFKEVVQMSEGKIQAAQSNLSSIKMGEIIFSKLTNFDSVKMVQNPDLKLHLVFKKNVISIHVQNKICSQALGSYFTGLGVKKFNIDNHTSFDILCKNLNKKTFVKLRSLSRRLEKEIGIAHFEFRHLDTSYVVDLKAPLTAD